MTPTAPDAEDTLEQATAALFAELGWQTVNAYHEVYAELTAPTEPGGVYLGRRTRSEVILHARLLNALALLNPGLPPEAYDQAIEEITRDRSALTLVDANRDVYALLKSGLPVTFRDAVGDEKFQRLRLVDWDDPTNNDFLLARQFWVSGEVYTKRADLVGFVNGLPFFFGELKAHHKNVEDAYRKNLSDYKDTIPHLLWYNAFILLSNGSEARVGTITCGWEHFGPWKKIDDEGEEGIISLETAVRGTCPRARFLDLVENYIIFQGQRGGTAKIVAKYHQYLGVENAMRAIGQIEEKEGRLGVFWHTQGSGKSISMVFFCQKVLRKLTGNWTFVLLTDRIDLDDQLYKNFARAGAVTEPEHRVRAQSGAHLQQLLGEDHRYLFTLIQKFGTERGARYPQLSDRSNVIVITDEAHRSQYDILAMNMRDALPNAAFLAFTATPLIEGEARTRAVFGDYVTVYSYKQSNEDKATVPLYYENRIPELQLTASDLNQEIYTRLEDAELDDGAEAALVREFSRQYHLITREDRLETIAEDIVEHFIQRGHRGKAMVISIDKLTTGRMYYKVQKYWGRALDRLRADLQRASDAHRRQALQEKIRYMDETDMAIVFSQGQGEVALFASHDIDIVPHRRRMVLGNLDEKFKDPDDPFRIVFVCAMWRTGFDVPCCSTIYLDRPMRNHTLMQTIARANRVFGEKVNGLIVDYVGIFRDLQRALAIYGTGPGGQIEEGEEPIQDKEALVELLAGTIGDAEAFCAGLDIGLEPIVEAEGFQRIALMDAAVDRIVARDQDKAHFLGLAGAVDTLFKAILPDARAGEFGPARSALVVLSAKIRALDPAADISDLRAQVEEVLDQSIEALPYGILDHPAGAEYEIAREPGIVHDLSKIDFEKLQHRFKTQYKHTETEKLRKAISARLNRLLRLNPSRADFQERFMRMIDTWNQGAVDVETFFKQLMQFAQELDEEEQRHIAENLSEEELAIFDLITRPDAQLTADQTREVKRIARDLLATLKAEKLVLDWRRRQQTRAAVQVAVKTAIWKLPESFSDSVCQQKSALVYQHVYDNYWGAWSARQSVYAQAA